MCIWLLFCGDLTIPYLGRAGYCFFIKVRKNCATALAGHRAAILFNSNLSISFYLLIIPYNSIRNTKILQTIPPQNRYNFKPSYLKKLFLLSSSSRIFCFITLVSVSDCFSRSFVALCIASIFACNAFLTSWTVFSLTSSFRLPISPDIAS